MHLAYPPRKSSTAGKYMPRQKAFPRIPRKRVGTVCILLLILLWWLFTGRTGTGHAIDTRLISSKGVPEHPPSGQPPVVLVTVLDTTGYPKEYIDSVRTNREQYAKLHGYKLMIVKVGDYDLHGSPFTWTKVVAMRHALTKFPDAKWLWYLDQDVFIMDPKQKLPDIVSNNNLEQVMIKDQPIVPPDSIIKTFSHLKGREVELVLTQDKEGISMSSFVVRNGEWAKFLLDTWYDPMYRSYNFQKAELHAMEHILQWHPTLLSKLALVPQKLLNSYSTSGLDGVYEDGDFAIRLFECTRGDGQNSCDKEGGRIAQKWRTAFRNA